MTGQDISDVQREKLLRYDPSKASDIGDPNALDYLVLTLARMFVGEIEAALDTVELAVDERNDGIEWTYSYAVASPFWCEPRYIAALERMNLDPPLSAAECAAQKQ